MESGPVGLGWAGLASDRVLAAPAVGKSEGRSSRPQQTHPARGPPVVCSACGMALIRGEVPQGPRPHTLGVASPARAAHKARGSPREGSARVGLRCKCGCRRAEGCALGHLRSLCPPPVGSQGPGRGTGEERKAPHTPPRDPSLGCGLLPSQPLTGQALTPHPPQGPAPSRWCGASSSAASDLSWAS